jgi:predicted metal-dependent phosphoesterase TrpH
MTHTTGKADLHLHTCHSDGAPTVRALLEHVATCTQLNVIAITDHDTIAGALEAQDILRQECYPIEVIVGEEVSTRDGHLVGLFLRERVPPALSAPETIAAIHEQGGLAFAPHPFFRAHQRPERPITMVGLGSLVARLDLDAIETINATPFLGAANRRAARFNAATTGLPVLGNSDGHILAAVGRGYTTFPGTTARDLYEAVLAGQTAAGAQPYNASDLLTYLHFWLRMQSRPPAPLGREQDAVVSTGARRM